jgi:prepilin-type N-terminal cleavage/methylation domain-containing protein
MKRNQSGFTLIEIAIVLVIIGLLLGGVMKGQELINSARVKNLAADYKNTTLYIYSYQDKYHALPGDDTLAASHVSGATVATAIVVGDLGNGRIDGHWDSTTQTHESYLFWQHVRLSGLATGITNPADVAGYPQRNSNGGLIGVTNASAADLPVNGLSGAYIICSTGIVGKFAKQLDIAMDDGNTGSGSMRAIVPNAAVNQAAVPNVDEAAIYTVCYGV